MPCEQWIFFCIFHQTETPLRSGVTARKPIEPCPEHEGMILIVSSLSTVDEHCSASALLRGFEVVLHWCMPLSKLLQGLMYCELSVVSPPDPLRPRV